MVTKSHPTTVVENHRSENWGDQVEIALFFAALFSTIFLLPAVFFGASTLPRNLLVGAPSALAGALGILLAGRRPKLAAPLLLLVAPLAMALGVEFLEAPRGGEGVSRELAVAVTAVAYFLGVARALGGPRGRLPTGPAQRVLLPAAWLLLAFGVAGASITDDAHYAASFGAGAVEARFLGSAIALTLASVSLLGVGPSLARQPVFHPRPPQQLVGRLILYFSLAIVGLLLLDRLG